MYTDKIISIKKIGIKHTYDFKVPIYNNLILANEIITHNSGKSNLILLLSLIQCRYAGTWRNKKTGRLVKALPRLKPLPDEWEHIKTGFSFKANMSFLDESTTIKDKFHALDQYQSLIIDEGSKSLHKYEWNSKLQFLLVKISNTERFQNKTIYVCFPSFRELNSVFRNERVQMRIFLYDRHKEEGYSSCIVSLKDLNRHVVDGWHTEENAKLFETLLKRVPAALRNPGHILYAEKKLAGYAGNFDVPSLEKIAPRIWDIYMKYKIYYAQKDAEGTTTSSEDETSIRVLKWKGQVRKVIDYVKSVIPKVDNKVLSQVMGMSDSAFRIFMKSTAPTPDKPKDESVVTSP